MFIAPAACSVPALGRSATEKTFRSYRAGLNNSGAGYEHFASPRRGTGSRNGVGYLIRRSFRLSLTRCSLELR